MAIKLVTEVMDWAPPLTHREHKVLIILAENARLPSRETWDSVESAKILRRAQLTRAQMYAVIGALVAKGCLEKPVWGGRNHRAKYRIARLTVPRPGKAAYKAYLAMLSPGERQALIYADRENWPVSDHDQCQEKSDTENHGQCPVLQDTEKPRSASRKVRPRLPVSTRDVEAQTESADDRSEEKPGARRWAAEGGTPDRTDVTRSAPCGTAGLAEQERQRNGATPSQSLRDHDGPDNHGDDDQQQPDPATLQSPAADRNAGGQRLGGGRTVGGQPPGAFDV